MESENINPMDEKEFTSYTRKLISVLGDDVLGFFTVIHDTFEYFVDSDTIIEKTQISLEEFEIMIKKITRVLGKKSVRFFKAVYDAMPKKTVTYLGFMVKVFESFFNQ
ncbi:MAG: hypothetical protein LBO80_02845 [Treponema sp.]|jgi:hypothetical protein|nr:hypothetical protein [Treponema sp.]